LQTVLGHAILFLFAKRFAAFGLMAETAAT
jgi:hypothetical protein